MLNQHCSFASGRQPASLSPLSVLKLPTIRRRRSHSICGSTTAAAASEGAAAGALLIEVDGALADLHMDGHRQAFCSAFRELGMDCTNWTPAIYHDLLSRGDGTGAGLVRAYYNCVGWPTFLPTSEQDVFASKVYNLKQEQMRKLLAAGGVPLRDGVTQVLEQALAAGFRLALIAETSSDPADDVVGSLVAQLPPRVASAVRVYASSLCRQPLSASDSQDEEDDDGGSSSSTTSLAAAASALKQKGAQEFVERLAAALAGKDAAVGVQIDPALLNASGASAGATTALIAAVAATLDVPAARCIVVGSSSELINAGAAAGMVSVAVPRKMMYSASYPAAAAKFEGFGPGLATFGRLQSLLSASAAAAQQQQPQQRQ